MTTQSWTPGRSCRHLGKPAALMIRSTSGCMNCATRRNSWLTVPSAALRSTWRQLALGSAPGLVDAYRLRHPEDLVVVLFEERFHAEAPTIGFASNLRAMRFRYTAAFERG